MIKNIIKAVHLPLQEEGFFLPKTSFVAFISGFSLLIVGSVCSLAFILCNKYFADNIPLLEASRDFLDIILISGITFILSIYLPLLLLGIYSSQKNKRLKELQKKSADEKWIKLALKQEFTFSLKLTIFLTALFGVALNYIFSIPVKISENGIFSHCIVPPSSLMTCFSTLCAIYFLSNLSFRLSGFTLKSISYILNSKHYLSLIKNNKTTAEFNNLPLSERLTSLEMAKSLGIDPGGKEFMKTVLTEYEKRKAKSLEEEKKLNRMTAPAHSTKKHQRL